MDISNLFFGLEYRNVPDLILRCLFLLLVSALVLWLIYLAVIKAFPAKKKINVPRDFSLKLRFLAALPLFLVVFSVYIYFFITTAKPSQLQWQQPSFYLNLLPQLIIYAGVIILFLINYSGYVKSLKKTEVNYA